MIRNKIVMIGLLAWLGPLVGGPTIPTVARSATVRVTCRSTGALHREWRGTGFCFQSRQQIVTAYHVILGASKIEAYSDESKRVRSARVSKVLPEADLALLEVEDDVCDACFASVGAVPQEGDELLAYGYALDAAKPDPTDVKMRNAPSPLKEFIGDKAQLRLSRIGFPKLGLRAYNFQADLVPGHSGAPIVNASGQLVAVADGGLMEGKIGRSWGIPAAEIPNLLVSKALLPRNDNAIIELASEFFHGGERAPILPKLDAGRIQTCAHVYVSARKRLQDTKMTLDIPEDAGWWPLPYKNGVEQLNYKDANSSGWASTSASMSTIQNDIDCIDAALTIGQQLGGQSGVIDSGGSGSLRTNWTGTLILPETSADESWKTIVSISATAQDVSEWPDDLKPIPPKTLGLLELRRLGESQRSVAKLSFAWSGAAARLEKSLDPASYEVTISSPRWLRGNEGGGNGNRSEGRVSVNVRITARRSQHN